MFVYSVKRNQIKLVLTVLFVVVSVITICFLAKTGKTEQTSSNKISVAAEDEQQRLGFLAQFGWKVDESSAEVTEVIIPEEFDDVYTQYNEIQLRQGFDLTQFAGRRVKKWNYVVTNYPGYENKPCIRATLLILNGRVIGGDICSVEIDGFMHTFDVNNERTKT